MKKFWKSNFVRGFHKKNRVFDVYWIQTNKQTDKPNLYIDEPFDRFALNFEQDECSYLCLTFLS